jgi:tetratricopeptide (TPR) repeat protein
MNGNSSWVEILTPTEIAEELAQGFEWLAAELRDLPERQRSMAAILTYSWQRSTDEEQAVLMRLMLFRGGFTRAAAQAVAGASLSMLARLVDKSFVQRTANARYDIHELVRQYAARQLELAGAHTALQAVHSAYYLNFLHDCTAKLTGVDQLAVVHQIEADFENLRAAWLWAVQTNNEALVDQALDGLFRWFWLRRTRQQEGLALLQIALEQWAQSAEEQPRPIWGRMLARLMDQQGSWLLDASEVQKRLAQALALAHQQGNKTEITFCTWALGLAIVSEHQGEAQEPQLQPAIQRYEQCIAAYRARADHFWLAQGLENLGHVYRRLDQCERAVPLLQESLALRATQGDRFGMARSLRELAWTRFNQGWEQETLEAAQAAYALQSELGDQQGIADSRFFLALAFLCRGDWQQAKELLYLVQHFADERNNTLYRRWAARALTIATCMEQNMHQRQSAACSFPNHFSAFTARFYYVLFSSATTTAYCNNVQKLALRATTECERALCALFAADLALRNGDLHRAVPLLAVALREPEVAQGWVRQLSELLSLQQTLTA